MSSVNLEALTTDFPGQKAAVEKLVTFLESTARTSAFDRVYSYDRMLAISQIKSSRDLVLVLNRLVQDGLLEQFVRVENNSAGIKDFASINEIPETIHDWRTDTEIAVTPDKLHLYYKLHAQS